MHISTNLNSLAKMKLKNSSVGLDSSAPPSNEVAGVKSADNRSRVQSGNRLSGGNGNMTKA